MHDTNSVSEGGEGKKRVQIPMEKKWKNRDSRFDKNLPDTLCLPKTPHIILQHTQLKKIGEGMIVKKEKKKPSK